MGEQRRNRTGLSQANLDVLQEFSRMYNAEMLRQINRPHKLRQERMDMVVMAQTLMEAVAQGTQAITKQEIEPANSPDIVAYTVEVPSLTLDKDKATQLAAVISMTYATDIDLMANGNISFVFGFDHMMEYLDDAD